MIMPFKIKINKKKKVADDYYLRPPFEQPFYRFMADMMSFFSVGDRTLWGYEEVTILYKINSTIMTVFGPACTISQFVYLYFNFSDISFDILGIIFSILPATVLANVNIQSSKFKSYLRISGSLLQKYHLYNIYKETKGEYVKKKLIAMEKITRWTATYVIFFFVSTWIGWITIPAINNLKNRDLVSNHTIRLQTCLFMWMPFDYSYNYRNWAILHTINSYTVLCGVCCIMIFQTLNYIFVYNLIGHLYVLKNSLSTDFKDDLSDEEVRGRLAKILKHHTFIIGVFKDVQTAFGLNVTTNYMQNLFGNSVLMYQLTYGGKENMMIYVMMIIAYTGAPILMSFVLEEIRRQSEDLPDVVYDVPWQKMSPSNQRILMVMLQRSQELMDFKAFGGMKAGVGPMVSILKTTFSYYVMLESSIQN